MLQAIARRPIRPMYAPKGWPGRHERLVNVLVEGPSISLVKPSDMLKGPVVAINHALALSRSIPIDCWATVDKPTNLWKWSKPHLPKEAILLTTENNIMFWSDLIGPNGVDKRLYAHPPTYMAGNGDDPAFLDDEGRPALLPTIFHVLGWLYSLRGLEEVRIFGCDMRGANSDLSFRPWTDDESGGWDFRWAVERKLLALSFKHFRSSGKRITRWARKG